MRNSTILLCFVLLGAYTSTISSFLVPAGGKSLQRLSEVRKRGDILRRNADNDNNGDKSSESSPSVPAIGDLFSNPTDPVAISINPVDNKASDEKIAAIQSQIASRIAVIKKEGQWSDGPDVFGKDPLATQPIWITMAEQLKVCKPFESVEELATTYVLLLVTTTFLTTYLLLLRDSFDGFIVWFIKSDFDNEFLSILFNQS
jgi:hypothetical protein